MSRSAQGRLSVLLRGLHSIRMSANLPPQIILQSMNLKPLGNHIILAAADKETTTALGIIIPDTADKERPERGTVIAVGPGKLLDNGTRQVIDVKPGDEIVFKKYAPDEIELKNPTGGVTKYLVVNADEVMAIIEK